MPEAPEVAKVLAALEEEIRGAEIVSASITHPSLCSNLPADEFEVQLIGEHFNEFHRLGKYLIFEMDNHDLVAHLRMEGKFLVLSGQEEFDALDPIKDKKHIHAVFGLSDGRLLCYKDTRKFGRMGLYDKPADWHDLPALAKVGKDALDQNLTAEELEQKAKRRKIPVKTLLLDQSFMAGIGNIYADEILFAAGISPLTPADHLDLEDWKNILVCTRMILSRSYSMGGTTLRTFAYGNHQQGGFQNELKVHSRKGACDECGTPIEQTRINGRSTWYCPTCQKEK